MGRTPLLRRLARAMRVAHYCEVKGISSREGLQLAAAADRSRPTRRQFLGAAAGSLAALGAPGGPNLNVGIVGAGLAGLVCGDELKRRSLAAALYDANDRTGGRCFSLRGFFPGQVAERGGEFIDNLHKVLLGYAQQFGLALEDVEKQPGEVAYFFNGQRFAESVVVDEYRALVAAMRPDLRSLSGEPTAEFHNGADVQLDNTNLLQYLNSRGAGAVIKAAVIAAYIAEYGLEPEAQSCLNFLLFIHADRRSKFRPFGVFSDERYHAIGGNDAIAQGLAARLAGQIQLGMNLVRARKTPAGRIELTFRSGNRTEVRTHDAVVLAVPFTVLRRVDLDASLGLPPGKRLAIDQLGYGTNAKMMVGFDARPWFAQHGSSGASYSDLANHQTTWETNPTLAGAHAILTDYSGGARGASLDPQRVQLETARFLGDLDLVYPGSLAAASRTARGDFVAHLEHWPSNPLTLGSYTCYTPGQFTTIAGNEGKPVGNLFFAGEHTNSFYDWQGFMEGAALSGIQAAADVLQRS